MLFRKPIVLVSITIVFVVILFVGGYSVYSGQKYMKQEETVPMQILCQKEKENIEHILGKTEQSVNLLSIYATDHLEGVDKLRDKKYCKKFTKEMHRMLLTNANNSTGVVATYLRLAPERVNCNAGIFIQRKGDATNFVDHRLTEIEKYNPKDIEHVGWYYTPKKLGRDTWVGPYYNKNVNVKMISYVMPLYKGTKFLGVLGMDIDLSYFTKLVEAIEVGEDGYAYLRMADGKIISHPDLEYGQIYHASENMLEEQETLMNGMTLVVTASKKEAYKSRTTWILKCIMACVIILVAMFWVVIRFGTFIGVKEESEHEMFLQLRSISDIYVSMHVINIEKNIFKEINSILKIEDVYKNEKTDEQGYIANASIVMKKVIRKCVGEQNMEAMLQFADLETLAERMSGKVTMTQEFKGASNVWHRARFIRINEKEKAINQVIFAIEMIDEEKRKENHLLHLAETDLMTGIRNRGSGEKAIRELMQLGKTGMFCLVDEDKFKSINDTYGHDVGDQVIIAIAECMQKSFRDKDIVFRLGGDEFAAYAVGVDTEEGASVILKRFFKNLECIDIPELQGRKISASVGAVICKSEDNFTFEELYKKADTVMYSSKEKDGSWYSFYKI